MHHALDPTNEALRDWLADRGHPAYRLQQIRSWLYERRATEFSEMTDLPAALREELAAGFCLWTSRVVKHTQAEDGTEKLLLEFSGGGRIECVLLRDGQRR